MPTSVLATKLYIPPPRTKVVLRPRLVDRLTEGLQGKLTLISAPAGFGKTTLVSEWIEVNDRPTAWLSLDEGDNDLTRFLTYFVAALQTIAPSIGDGILGALQASPPAPTDSLLTSLLNDITTLPIQFVLVLDDYHVIETASVNHALTFLLEHLPPQMHLVITTRDDPQLPVTRLRARGQLTELRATDLRFTPSEAADFLNHVMHLSLSGADIATLETRTEGWIAGLQLAALSVQGHRDVAEFIRAFAGDNRYIVDYLVDEVLRRQPAAVRTFLLQTAILNRMNGSLCDAVTGQQDGSARLEALERGNYFVIRLDDKRHWYRYHSLFADVLYAHLLVEQPEQVAVLHGRASAWYEQHDSTADAIHHALAAKDFTRAARLMELSIPAMRRGRQEATMLGWLQALPAELLRKWPVLNIHYAGTLLLGGKTEGVEARLRDAERWLDATADTGEMVVVDEVEFQSLASSIFMYRAAIALTLGDVESTLKYAHQLLAHVPDDDHLRRGAASGFLGLAYWRYGELEAAHAAYIECMAHLQKVGFLSDVLGCSITLADLRIEQGRLREAMSAFERGLQLATQTVPVLRGAADMHVGMSALYRERNELESATQHLFRSKELGEFNGLPQNQYRWCVAMARVRETEGDLDAALDLLHEAERLYMSDFSPNVHPIPALRVRLWIAQGKLGDALAWAREQHLSVEDDLTYLREYEHITLARLLMARYKRDHDDHAALDLMGYLPRLLQAAEAGGRLNSVIELLILLALAYHMQGDLVAALVPLERALTLAEPEGYVRVFVDEGQPMSALLEKAAKHGINPTYARQLLSALGKVEDKPAGKQALIDPLSERELEVLRLLGTDLDGPDLARELTVSLNTVRTHIKNIYTKLGVNNRRAAVRRAEELDLL